MSPGCVALAAAAVLGAAAAAPALAATADAPIFVSASPADGTAIVTFLPPPSDGGAPVTNYTVTASPGGATAGGPSSPVVVAGLADGTQYTFTVTDDNAFGTSVPSAPTLAVTPLAAPAATSAPVITGSPVIDNTLTASPGSWSGSTGAFSYQWFDCAAGSGDCSEIANATAASYTVSPLDSGDQIAVLVTAVNADNETATDLSPHTATVTAPSGAPVAQSPPTLSAAVAGQPLSATSGAWSGSPTGYAYQWYACSPSLSWCEIVSGLSSQGSTYTPMASDAGNVLEVAVVAANAVGHSVPALSSPSAMISFPPPTVSISFPAAGANYAPSLGAGATEAFYSCSPTAGETISSCTGSVADGSPIAFSPGSHTFTVAATDADGETATKTVDYTVGGSPAITVTGVGNGATYAKGVSLAASATCAAFDGSALPCELQQAPQPPCPVKTSLVGCTSSTTGDPPALDTSTLGRHTLTVSATDAYGETNTLSVSYTVVAGSPSASTAGAGAVRITGLAQSSASWRIGAGTHFAFTPSRAAVVTFRIARDTSGRRAGKRCESPSPANRRGRSCTLTQSVGSLRRFEPQGSDVVPFSGRLGSSTLPAGQYSVTVSAVPIGMTATHVAIGGTLKFTIVG
jgi:hypothetical protein